MTLVKVGPGITRSESGAKKPLPRPSIGTGMGLERLAGVALVVVAGFCLLGLYAVQPNQAAVLSLFGKYVGTVKEAGLRWNNPFYSKRKVSQRVRNFESGKLKVNDLRGNPIEMAAQAVADVPSVQFRVRIDGSEFPAEIAPLAEGVNGLLTRMEAIAEGNAAFAADVAHELRTPLTLLGLELERLDHPQAGPLQAQVHDMQKLVNQLMMIARLDAQELRREASQPVDLGMVCAGTVEQMAPKALQVGRFLGFDDLGAAPVLAEAESLGAALRNLVDNALRVTPEGGSVTVIAGPGPKIGVADGGPGLTQAELERLSHPHVRADHASSDGAGLGLSIVRKIADQFGGRLVSDVQLKRISIEFPPAPATARQGDVSNTG